MHIWQSVFKKYSFSYVSKFEHVPIVLASAKKRSSYSQFYWPVIGAVPPPQPD